MDLVITPKSTTPKTSKPNIKKEAAKMVYKAFAKLYHPDLHPENAEKMQEVNAYYNELKQLEKSKTHISIILDNSGSMKIIRHQSIGAYNKFVSTQDTGFGSNTFALTTFTQKGEITPLSDAQKLRLKDYACGGGTPLYKTITSTIKDIDLALNSPSDVVVIIITDGQDTQGGLEGARSLIEQKLDLGWQFIYCSPSWYKDQGLKLGIPEQCITTLKDISITMELISSKLLGYRSGRTKQITFEGK